MGVAQEGSGAQMFAQGFASEKQHSEQFDAERSQLSARRSQEIDMAVESSSRRHSG